MTSNNDNPNVQVFDRDAENNMGYVYTTSPKLSSRMAVQRSKDTILALANMKGLSVLDNGCGDGFFTCYFWDNGQPASMVATDAAAKAIEVANRNKGDRPINFQVADAHHIPFPDNSFDLVLIQSILHHDDAAFDIIAEGFRLAPRILIHEPNGNNFGLKIIEKTSRYHIEHNEKSYSSVKIAGWIKQAGGKVVSQRFAGFVPMFCPDWLARAMKMVEPIVENVPVLNALGCSVQVFLAERPK